MNERYNPMPNDSMLLLLGIILLVSSVVTNLFGIGAGCVVLYYRSEMKKAWEKENIAVYEYSKKSMKRILLGIGIAYVICLIIGAIVTIWAFGFFLDILNQILNPYGY